MISYLSVCSGIEAASVAWEPLGWSPVAFSEVDKFPSAVLASRFPTVPNLGDMTRYKDWTIGETIDVLVGGTPCQSFSVAGLRKGLDDPRGNLALVYCGLLARFRPRWFVWENVPGVLSSSGGRDFGSFLGAVAQLGYGFAYRVLDAQFFGVPQRRRRVFVVGHLGDWRRAAAVLFERESMRRDTPQGKGKKQDIAKTLRGRANSSHREDSDNFVTHSLRGEGFDASEDGTGRGTPLVPMVSHTCLAKGGSGRLDPSCETFIACTLPASDGGVSSGMHPIVAIQERAVSENPDNGPGGRGFRTDGKAYTLEARTQPQAVAFNARQDPDSWLERTGPIDTDGCTQAIAYQCHGSNVGPMGTLRSGNGNETGGVPFMAFAENSRGEVRLEGGNGSRTGALSVGGGRPVVASQAAVRRLTPLECERLQGFPDNWTAITYRGKTASDGPRYKSIGNSMAVPVMSWVGQGIQEVDHHGS